MKNILVLAFTALLFVAGCATGSHTVIGNVRPAIDADGVKIYATMPPGAETIALVQASNDALYKQRGTDSVMSKIRKEAGKLGANGVVITGQENNSIIGSQVSGTAIFVP